MSAREWIAVYVRLIRLPKFRRLPDSAQLTLVYLWCLAGDEEVEATWPSLGALAELLAFSGRPADDLEALIAAKWLDVDEDGAVMCHDWDAHQWAASRDAKNRWEADRARRGRGEGRWRNGRRDESPPAPPSTGLVQDKTGQDRGAHARARVRTRAHGPWNGSADDDPVTLRPCARCGSPIGVSSYISLARDGRAIHDECPVTA